MKRIGIVGAGFSGAVIARELAEQGIASLVVDERTHIGGNCHTERDPRTGIMVHQYGPHIFHTANRRVWDYINQFGEMVPYVNRVKATVKGSVYSLPINLMTINNFFNRTMSPAQAQTFIASLAKTDIDEAQSFEEQGMKFVGEEIYKAFFDGYTRKQWGIDPAHLPASILKRLPLRFNYDDNYFNHPYQAIPRHGYTQIIEKILAHPLIEVRTNCAYEDLSEDFDHLFYSGPLDRYFNFDLGRLGYRTLDFEAVYGKGDIQGTAVMNYPDPDIPFTRMTEHKYFAPWEMDQFEDSVAFREYSRTCGPSDIPYYPIRLLAEKKLLTQYEERAALIPDVTFVGRLGTYAYLDMDVTIAQAFDVTSNFLSNMDPVRISA